MFMKRKFQGLSAMGKRRSLRTSSAGGPQQYGSIPTTIAFTIVGGIIGGLGTYSLLGFSVLKNQLLPLEKNIQKLCTEVKELGTEMKTELKELRLETKRSFDELETQMKESNDKINSRVDSVLLRSLDLQRGSKCRRIAE